MDFGITIKPDLTIDRIVNLTREAESSGFTYGWVFDSHVIWMEPFPLLTLMASSTKNMRLGTCVTNPAVRDVTVSASLFATLNVFSHGRMQLGIGRGDSSRRVLGKKPTTLENLEEFVRVFRALNSRNSVELDGVSTRFPWATGGAPPVWVAGYGPKALRTAISCPRPAARAKNRLATFAQAMSRTNPTAPAKISSDCRMFATNNSFSGII